MTETRQISVLFVCTGNICRSPMAEAVFRHMVDEAGLSERIIVASAGTGNWHVGQQPHPGTLEVLARHAIDPGNKRARVFTRADFDKFNYIIAMDAENVSDIRSQFQRRVPRLLDFAHPQGTLNVPDPYYSGEFDIVYTLIEAGCKGLLEKIRMKEGI